MKKLLAICLTITMGLCLVACGCSDKSGSGDQTKITFCLDWTPNTNYTGLYVAKAMGYYEEAGLDVEIVQPPEDGSLAMCASGQAQFAGTAQDSLVKAYDSDSPLPITAVATILQHNTSGIMTYADKNINSPKDLEGKRYSTWQDPTELAMIKHLVTKDGGNYDEITIIPNDITNEPAALANDQTDALWVFYAWGGINAEVSDTDCNFMFFKDYDEALDYYTPIIVANDEFLKNDPETAKKFLEATAKGYEYAVDHPEEAADMLIEGDETGSLKNSKELVYKSQEWINNEYISDAPQWGYIDPARWDSFYKWLYDNKLTSKDFSGTGFTNEYLPEK